MIGFSLSTPAIRALVLGGAVGLGGPALGQVESNQTKLATAAVTSPVPPTTPAAATDPASAPDPAPTPTVSPAPAFVSAPAPGGATTSAPASNVTVIVQGSGCGATPAPSVGVEAGSAPSLAVDFELGLGLGVAVAGAALNGETLVGKVSSGGAGTAWSLGAEAAMGRRLWFGGGITRLEVDDPFSANGERGITSVEARIRGHLHLGTRWAIDLVARAGLSSWGDDGLGNLVGWCTRLGVGGAYQFAEGFAATAGLSHVRHDTFDLDDLAGAGTLRPYPTALAMWMLSVGVRIF